MDAVFGSVRISVAIGVPLSNARPAPTGAYSSGVRRGPCQCSGPHLSKEGDVETAIEAAADHSLVVIGATEQSLLRRLVSESLVRILSRRARIALDPVRTEDPLFVGDGSLGDSLWWGGPRGAPIYMLPACLC